MDYENEQDYLNCQEQQQIDEAENDQDAKFAESQEQKHGRLVEKDSIKWIDGKRITVKTATFLIGADWYYSFHEIGAEWSEFQLRVLGVV